MIRGLARGGLVALLLVSLGIACAAPSGRSRMDTNRAMSVTYGTVIGLEEVSLDSAAGSGAVLGGLAGLAVRGGGRTTRSIARGAAIGAVTTRVLEGSNQAVEHTVRLTSGRDVRIISDPAGVRMGDCVSVEQGRNTNIRRVSSVHCTDGRANTPTEDHRAEASACDQAMQALAEADDASIEAQLRRVRILCED